METIYEQLAELLEVDVVRDEQTLEDFESWDSLTVLSIIALASENYNLVLRADEIREFKTVGNLVSKLKD